MSSSSKYSGLAGTILLGTLLGLNYTQYARRKSPLADKAASYDPESETSSGSLFDKEGNVVPLGKTNLPGTDFVNSLRDIIPDMSPLVLCGALSALWAVRSIGAMNKVLNRRYADIVYQIRRPDIISNRITAWKYLGLGGMIVPAAAAGAIFYMKDSEADVLPDPSDFRKTMAGIADDSLRMGTLSVLRLERSNFTASVSEFSRTLRDGFRP
jgi:hypothetical protein